MNPDNQYDETIDDRADAAAATEGSHRASRGEGGAAAAGLPLRGLAMILIAVAVMLGLWGLYSLTRGGEENSSAAGGETTATAPQVSQDQTSGNTAVPAPAPSSNGAPAPASPESAQGTTPPGGVINRDGSVTPPAGGNGAAPAAGETKVNVVNNSTEGGLAERIYNDLRADGTQVGEHGNLPGEQVTLTETTVFYREGDAASEAAAHALAEEIGTKNGVPAVVKPNINELPAEMTAPGNITLALIGDVKI
ncbi:hypothetical protein CDOO_11895 [Corynebacterium doosanense CAU 212 = DSM 45436]|uniref:LytR/CpsA/Psr regulator C-terminal domain-containing protein n=1 Tax=Corynebacterium doosanense CAU 212 = DSM 45436 TaxID=558173 RepID=A0A097IJK8_9CORY|nr:hypothetical protein CDOO_11895 [Corynebacterium doosanense CAU 212 = DSM 45436]